VPLTVAVVAEPASVTVTVVVPAETVELL
jgi:hypothetical protein